MKRGLVIGFVFVLVMIGVVSAEDEYPSLYLNKPTVTNFSINQNGATYPICGEVDEKWCINENPNAEGNGPFEFKWGDEKISCLWFPGKHTYKDEGDYIIKVRSKNTCGFISERSSEVTISEYPSLDLFEALIDFKKISQNGVTFATCGEIDKNWCNFENVNANGNGPFEFKWDDGTVSCSWFPAEHTYENEGNYTVKVRVKNTCGFISERVNKISVSEEKGPENITVFGEYTAIYNFPRRFFDESNVLREQVAKVVDAQYLILLEMHNGGKPYDNVTVEYHQDVYGVTLPYGIALGDSAFPSENSGHHSWDVMSHEQGHNFFGTKGVFYWDLVSEGGPFIQESFAVLSALYVYHKTIENLKSFDLNQDTVDSLNFVFNDERDYQQDMFEEYVLDGNNFNSSDIKTSQALDYKMIVYGETYGWENYKKFTKAFEDGISSKFTFQNDGSSEDEQSTYIIAALGASFDQDFRSDFEELNFPIDNSLYENIYPKIKEYVSEIEEQEGKNEEIEIEDQPIEIPRDDEDKIVYICKNGCELGNTCYPLGYRKSGKYCSEDLEFVDQSDSEGICDNNFECSSNVCVSNECISEGLIKKILNWFRRLFGGE
ncbi:MAG: PKD domain-containing protein [archaeon]